MSSNNLKQAKATKKLLEKHPKLIHSENKQVSSHTQRKEDEWFINTIMIDESEVPFRFKRKKLYRNLKGTVVNLTYYPSTEELAGMAFEVMHVVRIRRA